MPSCAGAWMSCVVGMVLHIAVAILSPALSVAVCFLVWRLSPSYSGACMQVHGVNSASFTRVSLHVTSVHGCQWCVPVQHHRGMHCRRPACCLAACCGCASSRHECTCLYVLGLPIARQCYGQQVPALRDMGAPSRGNRVAQHQLDNDGAAAAAYKYVLVTVPWPSNGSLQMINH